MSAEQATKHWRDGTDINAVDIIHFNADGKITDFKVMVRPMRAINTLWQMMVAQLGADQSRSAAK